MGWWLLGAALAAPTVRQPTFAPAPNVFDAEWLIASSGICSDFTVGARIEFDFHPEASVTFTDAPFNKAVNLEEGVEIGGVDYSEVDILVSGSWTGKNLALLTPTSTCDDPPKGHQDEFDVTVFKVEENQACGEACVRYSGEVSTTSDNFVSRKDGRFLCQVFIEWGSAAERVGTRRKLRRRLSPLPLPVPAPVARRTRFAAPVARRTLFAPQPEKPVIPDPDVMKKWLIAAAGMCSSLSVTPLAERAGAYSIADISFEFHPDTSIAFTKAPRHDGVQLDDGVEVRGEEVGVIDVLASSVWELKNVALLRPVSSCDDPPEGQQDQYRVSVFKVIGNEPCADEPEKCVRYQGKVEARSSDFEDIDPDEKITMEGRFPCQLYVDTYGGEPPPSWPSPPPMVEGTVKSDGLVEWSAVTQTCTAVEETASGVCPAGSVLIFQAPQSPLGSFNEFVSDTHVTVRYQTECRQADWTSSFDAQHDNGSWSWSECPDGYAMVGIWRNYDTHKTQCGMDYGGDLSCLEYAWCCPVAHWDIVPKSPSCEVKSVTAEFDDDNVPIWGTCPTGTYMKGLQRSGNNDKGKKNRDRNNGLHNLEAFRCCGFNNDNTNSAYEDWTNETKCVEVEVNMLSTAPGNDGSGWKLCPVAFPVMAGMHKTTKYRDNFENEHGCSDSLGCIDKFWCCEAKPKRAALRFGPLSPRDTIDDCRTACVLEARWGGPFRLMAYDEKEKQCSCEHDKTRATAAQGSGNSVFDLWTPQGMEADEDGNWACLAPADGTTCPGGDERPCAASPMCVSDGRFEWTRREPCPSATWSCLALNSAQGSDDGQTLTHASCWFPRGSPLGLMLASPPGMDASQVLVPAALAALERQCQLPPFLFAYAVPKAASTFDSPGLGPPSRFGCDRQGGTLTPYSVTADMNVEGDCSSAPGGNSDLGGCSSQADCEAQCNSNAKCLGFIDMSSQRSGYMLKNYVGPDCLKERDGFVLHEVEHRLIYDDVSWGSSWQTAEQEAVAERWDSVCGDIFWSQVGPSYDWSTLLGSAGAVTGCAGSACIALDGVGDGSIEMTCAADCRKDSGSSCSFSYPAYGVQLVQLSNIRVAKLLSSDTATLVAMLNDSNVPNGTSNNFYQTALLSYVQTSLNGYYTQLDRSMLDYDSSWANTGILQLIASQIGNIGQVTASLASMPDTPYVPAFNAGFFTKTVGLYMDNFRKLAEKIDDLADESKPFEMEKTLLLIDESSNSGAKAVTAETIKQTEASISAALMGMQGALDGINKTKSTMQEAADELEEALKDYRRQQRIQAILSLTMGIVDMGFSVGAKVFNTQAERVGESYTGFFKLPSKTNGKNNANSGSATFQLLTGTQTFVDAAVGIGYTCKDVADANEACNEDGVGGNCTGSYPNDIATQSQHYNKFMTEAFGFDYDLVPDASSTVPGGPTARLVQTADELNKVAPLPRVDDGRPWNDNHLSLPQVLPLMGTGFWQEWVADVKQTYNPYLTGYNSDVNAAAQKVVDYLVVQSYYGNDYTTQGTRYVAAIQQYQIDLTQQQALETTDAAINAAIDDDTEVIADNLIQQTALTIRISALALQMDVVVKQLCASYQYQMTQLYTQCVDATTANPLSMMPVCGGTSEMLSKTTNEYLEGLEGVYNNAMAVSEYVTNGVWGNGNEHPPESVWLSLSIVPWDPPPCENATNVTETTVCDVNQQGGTLTPYSVTADMNVEGDCSSAPGGNSDLGGCSSQADCEAQCNSNAKCLGFIDMSSKDWGYMLKNYVGPDCLEERDGFVLHVNEPESDAAGSLPHYRYYNGTDCYTADEPQEANTTCCDVTRTTWTNCSYDPPKTPYVTMQAWRDFQGLGDKNKTGVLSFTIDESWVASTLNYYNEAFITGLAYYVPGAYVPEDATMTLTPTGTMVNKVKDSSGTFVKTEFVGAPSGQKVVVDDTVWQGTVGYSYYYKTPDPITGLCDDRAQPTSVFYDRANQGSGNEGGVVNCPVTEQEADGQADCFPAPICPCGIDDYGRCRCETVKQWYCPCYDYCIGEQNPGAFDGDGAEAAICGKYNDDGPYNWASIYSTFEFRISDGLETTWLEEAQSLDLGIWVRTYGRNTAGSGDLPRCDMICDSSDEFNGGCPPPDETYAGWSC